LTPTCLDAGASILTRNARHFERVPGLEVLGLE
jgi:predicted nucleic acid-binding protein